MNGRIPAIILAFAALAAGPAVSAWAETPPSSRQVGRIRHWTAPDHTRIVLDMSGESAYDVRVLDHPHRIVIEIPGGRFSGSVKPLEIGDGVIERVRVNQLRSRAQIVLDLPSDAPYTHFALQPNRNLPYRIVVDVKKVLTVEQRRHRAEQAARIAGSGDRIVIIDPGHGGSKPGSCTRYAPPEKQLALQLARMVAAGIDAHEGCRAVMTRTGDYDVDLLRRVEIARSHGGHCFVSIHFNGSESSRPRGSEVYFLSMEGATDRNAASVAERENRFIEARESGESAAGMGEDVTSIISDFRRNETMHRSSVLAERVGERLRQSAHIPFRGVKQANFSVLWGITMPAILVEGAYLTNRRDAKLLGRRDVLEEMAKAIADGVVAFLGEAPPAGGTVAAAGVTHTVAAGETLWGISRRYGISVTELRRLNGLGGGSRIRPGQKLNIGR